MKQKKEEEYGGFIRKAVLILAGLMLVLVLAACQNDENNNNNANNNNDNAEASEEDKEKEEEKEKEDKEKEEEKATEEAKKEYEDREELGEIDGVDDVNGITLTDVDERLVVVDANKKDVRVKDDNIELFLTALGYDDEEDEYFVDFRAENLTDEDMYLTSEDMKVNDNEADEYGHMEATVEEGEIKEDIRYALQNNNGEMDEDPERDLHPESSIEFTISAFEGDSDEGERINSYKYELHYPNIDSGHLKVD